MMSTLVGEHELFALKSLQDKLVTILIKENSRTLCTSLFEQYVLDREVMDKFSRLDHVHLKEELKVRYFVQHLRCSERQQAGIPLLS